MNTTTKRFARTAQRPWEGVVTHYRRPGRIRDWLLATAIGVGLSAWLVAWWSS